MKQGLSITEFENTGFFNTVCYTVKSLLGGFIMSNIKTLDVSTVSISEVKKSPGDIFRLASITQNAVYVFNRGDVQGVMITREQFEGMASRIEDLEERLFEAKVARRLLINSQTIADSELRGRLALENPILDVDDGWE